MMLNQEIIANHPKLTPREMEILELVARGQSTKEVAKNVNIAPRTVDRHVENIRLKLRAKNRSHMVTCAIVEGLLDLPQVEDDEAVQEELFDAVIGEGEI